jgi:hypothetical protein
MLGENAPRNATIHEYLDWTVTAREAVDDTEYVRLMLMRCERGVCGRVRVCVFAC